MQIFKRQTFLLSALIMLLTGCFTPKATDDTLQVNFARKDTALIKEMAEYALIFGQKNNVSEFETSQIADKKIRRQISSLGSKVKITYHSSSEIYSNSVVFKIMNFSGVKEYIYDFSSLSKNLGTDTSGSKKSVRIQTSERTYYQRRPFPMM